MDKRDLVSVFDYENAAREALPSVAYDYYAVVPMMKLLCGKTTPPTNALS
jgi:hypothetical protein